MKDGRYETSKEQVLDFERSVNEGEMTVREALRLAMICGACKERSRTLRILREKFDQQVIADEIIAQSVNEVLGFEKAERPRKA